MRAGAGAVTGASFRRFFHPVLQIVCLQLAGEIRRSAPAGARDRGDRTMREMHKWKDKVELSLDNRQIFFLFFGLSVIGCFVFALGIMTGRRLQWEPGQQAAAIGNEDSLARLDEIEDDTDERFAFRSGPVRVRRRSPAADPRSRVAAARRGRGQGRARRRGREGRAGRAARGPGRRGRGQGRRVAKGPGSGDARGGQAQRQAEQARAGQAQRVGLGEAGRVGAGRQAQPRREAIHASDEGLLAGRGRDKLAASCATTATTFGSRATRSAAAPGTASGSASSTDWDDALAAKQAFEKAEHVIAYVVSL